MKLYLPLEEKGVMGGANLADVQPSLIYLFSKDYCKVSHFLWKYTYINFFMHYYSLSLFCQKNEQKYIFWEMSKAS